MNTINEVQVYNIPKNIHVCRILKIQPLIQIHRQASYGRPSSNIPSPHKDTEKYIAICQNPSCLIPFEIFSSFNKLPQLNC